MLANHQSTADVPLLMACFSVKPRIIPNIMWIMDHVFKFTNFGVVSILHQDFFVKAVNEMSIFSTRKSMSKILNFLAFIP